LAWTYPGVLANPSLEVNLSRLRLPTLAAHLVAAKMDISDGVVGTVRKISHQRKRLHTL